MNNFKSLIWFSQFMGPAMHGDQKLIKKVTKLLELFDGYLVLIGEVERFQIINSVLSIHGSGPATLIKR